MKISLIAAMSQNKVIGNNNSLPWHVPEELKFFKETTLGKPVIMGRKTFDSLGKKPLPKRKNIILSSSSKAEHPECITVHSPEEALQAAAEAEEVMVIGGAQIYQAFLPFATHLYLSTIHQTCEGDTFFPNLDWDQWKLASQQEREGFTIQIFEKRPPFTH